MTVSNSSMFVLCNADTSTATTSPPTSSVITLCCKRSCLTFNGLAPGASILFIANTIGALDAKACCTASIV